MVLFLLCNHILYGYWVPSAVTCRLLGLHRLARFLPHWILPARLNTVRFLVCRGFSPPYSAHRYLPAAATIYWILPPLFLLCRH